MSEPDDLSDIPIEIQEMAIAAIRAAEPRIRADERARLRKLVQTLGGYIRQPDEYVPVGVILMLLGDDDE